MYTSLVTSEANPGGLMFYCICFFLFLSPRVLRCPSADCHETLPHDRKLTEFYDESPKVGGGALP